MSALDTWLLGEWLSKQFTLLNRKVDQLMAQVQVDQDALDALATQLETVKSNIATEIQNLQNAAGPALPAGSLDGLNTALTDLQGLTLPPVAPPGPSEPPTVEPTPTPTA